jgi:hypothetical protein
MWTSSPLPPERRAKPRELEHAEQVALINWTYAQRRTLPALVKLFAIPNGGQRSKAVAWKLRAEGVQAGVSDLCLPVARRGFYGLYLEMKSAGGSLSPDQVRFQQSVRDEGYCAVTAWGWEAGRQVLLWYLGVIEHAPFDDQFRAKPTQQGVKQCKPSQK